MSNKNIKAFLFDSGKVLNGPVSGHWFMPPRFFQYIDEEVFHNIDRSIIATAFEMANSYIVKQKHIISKEEEYFYFVNFYSIFAENVQELGMTKNEIELLAKDLVYNDEKYIFYDDAISVIPKLRKKHKLGIVSDAWPSLLDVYKKAKMDIYFDGFIISSMIGVTKPNKKMYLTALEKLGILPSEAIFIDDNLDNCMGAIELGIRSILLCRDKEKYHLYENIKIDDNLDVINTLAELEQYL